MRATTTLLILSLVTSACDSSSSSPAPIPAVTTTPPAAGGESNGSVDPNAPVPATGIPVSVDTAKPLNLQLGLKVSKADFLLKLGETLSAQGQAFRQAADALNASTQTFCSALTPESKAVAQSQWKEAMAIWQYFEVFQFGPVTENAKSLKYGIYGWPDPANYCKIDEEALKASKTASFKLPPNNNRKGMQALEYLLFEEGMASRCPAASSVATEWNALDAAAKWQTRCAYLKPLAADLAKQGALLQEKWGSPADNYVSRRLSDPEAPQQLIQALYENLFYLDLEVKNQKLAAPAGVDANLCPNAPAPCLDKSEFVFSNFSRTAINVNIKAFVDVFFGPELGDRKGGFSALVRNEGNPAIADSSETHAAELATLMQTDPDRSLGELIQAHAAENCDVSSNGWICKVRASIKQVASDLKSEYANILKVKAPEAAQGDND